MNKSKLIVIGLLVLLLVPGVMNTFTPGEFPSSEINDPVNDFTVSTDGDKSSDSISSFGETLPGDTLYYPDLFYVDTVVLSTWGIAEQFGTTPIETGDLTDIQTLDTNYWWSSVSGAGGGNESSWFFLDFAEPSYDGEVRGVEVNTYFDSSTGIGGGALANIVAIREDGAYVDFDDIADGWVNSSVQYGLFGNGTHIRVKLMLSAQQASIIAIDYIEVKFYIMTLADSDHYAESFADVSDWSKYGESSGLPAESFSSDGDVGEIQITLDDTSTEYVIYEITGLDIDYNSYAELRFKVSSQAMMRFRVSSSDYAGGVAVWDSERGNGVDTWTTLKAYIPDYLSGNIAGMWIVCDDYANAYNSGTASLFFDYLRIGPSDEMGLQHDGSTTEGFDERTLSVVSDGDTLNISNSGTSDYCNLWFDTTSTVATISDNYYPFVEFNISAVKASTNTWYFRMYDSDGTPSSYGYSYATGIFRFNLAAVANLDDLKFIRFYCVANQWFTLEYVKLYSIANFTYDNGGSESTNDYSYVDSGNLIVNTDVYTKWNHDPTLSTAIGTYNVWGATLESGDSSFRFRELGDTNTLWDQGETRGVLVGTTLTDFDMLIYGNCEISAITFLEDNTAPSIVQSNANPPEPADDETVTLSALVYDLVEVYTVKFNAVVYPAGFSDVDYSGSESATNFWTYSFSTLLEGYYSFSVIASDGAQENNLLSEHTYVDLTVRESEITISPISFFGVGDDFSQMSLSFEINRDCSYTIYEASATEAEAATGSGTVNQGWDNIAWDKLTVTDLQVNFSIKFETGALSTWVNGSYSVAQTAFVLEDCFITEAEKSFTITGSLTKAGSWAIRWDGAAEVSYSGSESEGYVSITWTKHETPGSHTWLLTFSNTSSFSLGGSFEVYQTNIDDKPGPAGPPVESDWRINQTTWQNIALLLIVLGVLANLFKGQTKLNLPNIKDSDLD